jgi:hypothetical protein
MSSKKTKFKFKKENFHIFIDKIAELTNIGDLIKIKIDSENILIYSTLGKSVILAFKNFLLKTDDFLEYNKILEEIDSCDIIIANAGKWVKNINFLKEENDLSLTISGKMDEESNILNARTVQIDGGRLKINWMGAESYEIRDMNKNILSQRLDLKHRKWYFNISQQEFNDVKKLSNINSDKIVYIQVTDGNVLFSEVGAWEMQMSPLENGDVRTTEVILNKRFLKSIKDNEGGIEFNLFDTFILIKDQESNLMLSYEQNFDDDDI